MMEDDYEHQDLSLVYTPVSIPGRGCPQAFYDRLDSSCDCTGPQLQHPCSAKDDSGGCQCRGYSGQSASYYYSLLECSELCRCEAESCQNRTVGRGPTPGLYLRDTGGGKNLGLFCRRPLAEGTFVTSYAGEIISKEEGLIRSAADKSGRNYLLFVHEHFQVSI